MTLNKKMKIAQLVITTAGAAIVGLATAHVSKVERKGKLLETLVAYAARLQEHEEKSTGSEMEE